jgi:peptidoglycan/LPS O-acetylase OafA/YrhL
LASTTPTATGSGRPFFDRIESLRGLGTLAVAGYHFTGCCLHGVTLLPQAKWGDAGPVQTAIGRVGLFLLPGHAALMAFFVISGFVLRVSLAHGPQSVPTAGARFAIARIFRVYPIVLVATIIAVLLAWQETGQGVDPRQFLKNLLLLDVSLNRHLWALQVELLMVPVILVLYFAERRWGPGVPFGVALIATGLSFAPGWAGWRPLSSNLFAFALGMAIPTIGRSFATRLSRRSISGVIAGSVAVMLCAGPSFGVYSRFSAILEAYAATALICLIAYRPDVRAFRLLDGRWLRRLGAASGSYYVLHMATVPPVMAAVVFLVPASWSAQATGVVGVAVIGLWLAAIAPVLIAISGLVEFPGISLGRRVIRRLGLESPSRRVAVPQAMPERRAA